MKIRKNDKVKIILGKDRGRTGTVKQTFPKKGKILVSGVNIVKKHVKPSQKYKEGGIVKIEKPVDFSNVMLICPKCGKPTRVGYQLQGNRKFRVCRKCKEIIGPE